MVAEKRWFKPAVSDFADAPNTNDDYYSADYREPECPSPDPAEDNVNSPLHYAYGKIEVIDFIMQTAVLYRGDQAVLVGNVLKYLARAPLKGNMKQDLEKASWYLKRLLEVA
jgi:hypothetical protein